MPYRACRSLSSLIPPLSVLACLVAALPGEATTARPAELPESGQASRSHREEPVPPRDLPEYQTPALWHFLREGSRPEESGAGAIIGLKSQFPRGVWKDRVLVTSQERSRLMAQLKEIAGLRVDWEDPVLPRIFARIESQETLEAIRGQSGIDYVAPLRGRSALAVQSFGCGFGRYDGPPAKETFRADEETGGLFGPFLDFVPWSFVNLHARAGRLPFSPAIRGHRIPEAWRRVGGGDGVRLVITDTGIKGEQHEVIATDRDGSRFATGASQGRTMTELDAFTDAGDELEDRCSHGTLATSTALAPMNDEDEDSKTMVGVAWAADGTSVRIGDDVWIYGADYGRAALGIRRGVCGGTTSCSTAPNPRTVISMAWGDVFLDDTPVIEDEINFWFSQGTVLFLAAAGTQQCLGGSPVDGTIFPAFLSNVVAVTCVDPRTGSRSEGVCNTKDVAGVWGKPASSGLTGDVFAGGQTDDPASNTSISHFGGSSACVSTVAGIAALTWSKHPDFDNVAVRQRLNESGHLFPNKHSQMGFGVVDAFRAVGGLGPVVASAPFKVIKGTPYTVQSAVAFGDGPLRFEWTEGSCLCRYNNTTGQCSDPACPLVGTCTVAGQSHPRCRSISVQAPATAGQHRQIHLAVFDEGSLDQAESITMKESLAVTCAAEPNNCGSRTCGSVPDGCGGTYFCGSCGLNEYCSSAGHCACSAPYHRCGNGSCTKAPCWEP